MENITNSVELRSETFGGHILEKVITIIKKTRQEREPHEIFEAITLLNGLGMFNLQITDFSKLKFNYDNDEFSNKLVEVFADNVKEYPVCGVEIEIMAGKVTKIKSTKPIKVRLIDHDNLCENNILHSLYEKTIRII